MHPEPRRGMSNAIVSQSCRECTIDGYASPIYGPIPECKEIFALAWSCCSHIFDFSWRTTWPPSLDGYPRASPPSQKHGLAGTWAKTGFGEAGLTSYAITSLPVQSLVGIASVSIALRSSSL